jgi:hypothetical protein
MDIIDRCKIKTREEIYAYKQIVLVYKNKKQQGLCKKTDKERNLR